MNWIGTAVLIFLGAFLAGFVAVLVGLVRVNFRRPHAPPWTAPFVERVIHSQKRMQDFFFSPDYRLERLLIGGGFTTCFVSMAIMLCLTLIFGENGQLDLS